MVFLKLLVTIGVLLFSGWMFMASVSWTLYILSSRVPMFLAGLPILVAFVVFYVATLLLARLWVPCVKETKNA